MSLSDHAVKQLMIAAASADVGHEVADAINASAALPAVQGVNLVRAIVATDVSQTVDFGSLKLGDRLTVYPATAGALVFLTCQNLYASGSVTYTVASGAQTVVVSGHSVGFASDISDALTATAAAAAITADPVVSLLVAATVDGVDPTKVNIVSRLPGTVGNYTLTVTGTGAAAGAATLTGGATAGELPRAAVVGSLYLVTHSFSAPAAVALPF